MDLMELAKAIEEKRLVLFDSPFLRCHECGHFDKTGYEEINKGWDPMLHCGFCRLGSMRLKPASFAVRLSKKRNRRFVASLPHLCDGAFFMPSTRMCTICKLSWI